MPAEPYQHPRNHALAPPAAVAFGCVDQIQSEIDGLVHRRN